MSVNVLFAQGNCGSWDQGLLLHAISGRLWPLPCDFLPAMGLIPPNPGGAIVVFAGRHLATEDGIRYMKAGLAKLPWALCLHLGDEELVFPSEQLRYPGRRIALQCPSPYQPIRGDRRIPLGPPEDARAWLSNCSRKAASGRAYLWNFSGQRNHAVRERMYEELCKRPKIPEGLEQSVLHVSDGFGQGYGREKYYNLMADSSIVVCPTGNFSPETFRLYEALEAGCLPICDRLAPNGGWEPGFDFYRWMFGAAPFPTVDDWSEVHGILDFYGEHPAHLQDAMTRCLAFWIGEKRRFALDLVGDCRELGADVPVPPVTVLIPTAPCPTHPSTDMIADTIRRIRSYPELARAEVIIMCDGVRPDLAHRANDYQEYLRVLVDRCNWDPDFFGCLPLIFPEWTHQAGMARKALELVRTPLVFYVEHDTFPMGDIPFGRLFEEFDRTEDANHIRLHIFESVLPEHGHLYGMRYDSMIPTAQYSQRPHLARTSWYRELLEKFFKPGEKSFIEDTLHGAAQDGLVTGLYVYAPNGSMLRSGTVDGRRDDPKAPHGVGR